MKRGEYIVLFIVIFVLVGFNFVSAAALELTVSDVNPSSVEANEDFIVGIQILNTGDENVEEVLIEFESIGGGIELKENRIVDLGFLRASGGMKTIVYNFHTNSDVVAGVRPINLKLSWRAVDNDIFVSRQYSFDIIVVSEKPQLAISGIKSKPERVFDNQDFILTIKIENSGEGSAKNVRVKINGLEGFDGVKEAYLGEIEPQTDLPARFVLKGDESGNYNYDLQIFYESFGQDNEKEFSLDLTIFSQSINYYLISFVGIIIIVIILILYQRYSKKKKVI